MESAIWTQRRTCRLCNSENVSAVIDLAPIPIATPNFKIPAARESDPVFCEPVPMPLHLCSDCGHLQILFVGNPEVQYRDYTYTTSLSLGLAKHFEDTAAHVIARLALQPGDNVLEFGSNDGTYLRAFQAAGMSIAGIDPAVEIARHATSRGIPTIGEFFSMSLARKIREETGPVDLLVANNVIANIDNLADVFHGAKAVLKDDGAFVFETQYGLDVTEHLLLDTVYHEHLSYFNVAPLQRALKAYGLTVFDVERIPTKGGSIRVYTQPIGAARPCDDRVEACLRLEQTLGCEQKVYFDTVDTRITAWREQVHALMAPYVDRGTPIAGYGVSVGTTSLLAQLHLEQAIDFVVDDDPDKPDAMIGPGYRIPVCRPGDLISQEAALTILFAWRYAKAITEQHADYARQGGKFLLPLPDPAILSIQ